MMEKEELKKHVEEIIKETFSRLDKAYQNNREGIKKSQTHEKGESRIVFPCYDEHQDYRVRISEQELRFAFVETFNTYCDINSLKLFYSIETPTQDTYSGFANINKEPKPDPNGRSAEFDLVIYDEQFNRIGLFEFKANNAGEHDHWKDFVKLENEKEGNDKVLRYFIEVIKSYTSGDSENTTIGSLKRKIEKKGKNTIFRCYALEGESSKKKDIIKGEDISKEFE